MVTKSFNLLFWLKKPFNYSSGPIPIYVRITINDKRVEYSVQRKCDPSKWNPSQGRALGNKEEIRMLNTYLNSIQRKVYEAHQSLIDSR